VREPVDDDRQMEILHGLLHMVLARFQKGRLKLFTDTLEGITPIELVILDRVGRNPDVIIKEIKEKTGVSGSTLTSAIDRLRKRNFLRRFISERDRRSFGLKLTAEGQRALEELAKQEQLLYDKLLSAFQGKEERLSFLTLLEKAVQKLF
jgi:DNA-binding MarR family transcriptional regulator